MTDQAAVIQELLATALRCAADVAQARVGKPLQVVESPAPQSSALLRFDLKFDENASICWFVSNEDATGFSDMLIGGAGDRSAVLTEMHLEALSGVFTDMLMRAVEGLGASLGTELEAGGVDMGMESSIPDVEDGGAGVVLALQIEGFGLLTIVEHANASMVRLLRHLAPQATGDEATEVSPVAAVAADGAPASIAGAGHEPQGTPTPPAATQSGAPAAGPVPVTAAAPAGQAQGVVQAAGLDNVVQLPNLVDRDQLRSDSDLRMLLNVPLNVTVELGRTDRTVREILELSVGSILELGKLAGDPMDIMVNGQVLARGEVVVMDEEFGVRVTEILSREDRMRRLG